MNNYYIPIRIMSSTDAGFNLKKTPDSTKSVVINYLPIGLSSIFRDEQNKYII